MKIQLKNRPSRPFDLRPDLGYEWGTKSYVKMENPVQKEWDKYDYLMEIYKVFENEPELIDELFEKVSENEYESKGLAYSELFKGLNVIKKEL